MIAVCNQPLLQHRCVLGSKAVIVFPVWLKAAESFHVSNAFRLEHTAKKHSAPKLTLCPHSTALPWLGTGQQRGNTGCVCPYIISLHSPRTWMHSYCISDTNQVDMWAHSHRFLLLRVISSDKIVRSIRIMTFFKEIPLRNERIYCPRTIKVIHKAS